MFIVISGCGYHYLSIGWLVGASLFFYGWWNPVYIPLIISSILFNFLIGIVLGNHQPAKWKKPALAFGISVNLFLLGYFKYANFFVDNLNLIPGADFHLEKIILPLAISFFTFQQIAYLVDAYYGRTDEYNILRYSLFVSFFPQLIAGPIVHHKEMLPQFSPKTNDSPAIPEKIIKNMAIGLTIFTLGLFKKVVLADGFANYVGPVFGAADGGSVISFVEAWTGTISYTFQLYFDFSGYSDMAIGSARIFGIVLPINFNSPYKANNIIQFWRRWHMTLARFLREYLYFPLGGNRCGEISRYRNIMITMLLGGLWHGAGWNFLLWGGFHGCLVVANHMWRHFRANFLHHDLDKTTMMGSTLATMLTFFSVVVGWVLFRAESLNGAKTVISAMFAFDVKFTTADLAAATCFHPILFTFKEIRLWTDTYLLLFSSEFFMLSTILLGFIICWIFPSTSQLAYKLETERSHPFYFYSFSILMGLLVFVISLFYIAPQESPFLYFQF